MRQQTKSNRQGKVLVMMVVTLPALFAVVSLTINASRMQDHRLDLQHAADAAAVAAAVELMEKTGQQVSVGRTILQQNGVNHAANVAINCPPLTGTHAGSPRHVEVIVQDQHPYALGQALAGGNTTIRARSVAAVRESPNPMAVVILDPSPAPLSIPPLPGIIPALPALLGGVEVEGLGAVRVNGSVVVNTNWGGLNEKGLLVGLLPGLPGLQHSISCTPLLPLTSLRAHEIYVTGGVDNLTNYRFLNNQTGSPVKANRRPLPDPFKDLPVPTVSADPNSVQSQYRGGEDILSLPILLPAVVLRPGVYDYINIIAGRVRFEPGVYIIRGKHPLTSISLQIVAGNVQADGVMFYITDSGSYNANSGSPDRNDGENNPGGMHIPQVLPSVVINAGLLNSYYSGLDAPGSPFDKMLIYQRRTDRRPIVIVKEDLLGNSKLHGTIYAKWGHVILAGKGTFNTTIVAGTARFLSIAEMSISPSFPLSGIQEITLVE